MTNRWHGEPTNHAQTASIVLIEDDDGHATLVERNLRRAGANPLAATNPVATSTSASRSNTIRFIEAVRRLGFFLQVGQAAAGASARAGLKATESRS
ncbi:hypothetical protein [Paraburkholderia youngii]|uniref:hypothetical protein n=1 Tax=Paraburkholderia youngii TaxID=2782701 RepID=UPI003D1A97FE